MLRKIQAHLYQRRHLIGDVASVSGARVLRQVSLMLTMAVAARFLSKELLGIWALIFIVLNFGVLISEAGISSYVVRTKRLNHGRYATAFWLTTVFAMVVIMIVSLLTIPMATWFGFQDYRVQVAIASLTILPMAMNGLIQAKLRRQRRFHIILLADAVSSTVMLCGSITMLVLGYQLWAFVLPTLAGVLFGLAIVSFATSWPRLFLRPSHIQEIKSYASGIIGFASIGYWARNVDHVLIGRFLGTAALGVYSFAYRIMMLPLSQINATAHSVALPYLSPLQDDHRALRERMQAIVAIVGMLATLPMIWVWLERDLVIAIVLGPDWNQVAELLAVLAPIGILQALVNPTGLCFQVTGQTRTLFRIGVLNTAIMLLAFAIGVWWGDLHAVVIAYAAANVLSVPLLVGTAMRSIGGTIGQWFLWVTPFFGCAVASWGIHHMLPQASDPWTQCAITLSWSTPLAGIAYWMSYKMLTPSIRLPQLQRVDALAARS